MIAIKNMKMPDNCRDCKIKKFLSNCPCMLGFGNPSNFKKKRHAHCPLIEIKQESDCVSRQAVIKYLLNCNANLARIKAKGIVIEEINSLPPITTRQDNIQCKDCMYYDILACDSGACLNPNMDLINKVSATHYCSDFKRREKEKIH